MFSEEKGYYHAALKATDGRKGIVYQSNGSPAGSLHQYRYDGNSACLCFVCGVCL